MYFFIKIDSSSSKWFNLPITIDNDKGKAFINSESICFYNEEKEGILFLGSNVCGAISIKIKNDKSYKVVKLGYWYEDSFNGNGLITVNNA